MKWWINLLTLLVSCSAESSQCPGSKASCPVASTCCQIGEGILGCCPIQNAVCCEDSKHCCPRGYSCDVNRGVCKMGSKLAPLLKKILATPTSNEIASKDVVVCPGGEGQCPTDHSCCTVPGGNQLHCCPLGYSCDRGMCRETEVEFPAAMLITSPDKVVKCSQQFACPDRYTCCTRDSYQCCPLPEAVCCSDNKHCCPRGFKCSDDGKSCLSGSHSIVALSTATPKRAPKSLNKLLQQVLKTVSKEWLSRTVTEQIKLSVPMTVRLVEKVICPGGESFCPSGQTCCKVASGQWGCCPLSRAVCCSDGVHCCPHDYTCDLAKQTCERNSDSIAILTNTAALKSGRIICPDHISECPDNNTCCKLASEGWACCPLPNAVCCSDGEHCCPEGYTCDTSGGTCKRGMKTAPMLVKTLALKKTAQTGVVCPGGESQCPDDSTCCKLSSGEYGCCPLPNAVCCSDGEHCCPEGYTCDVSAGTCNHGRKTIALLHKIPAIKKIVKANIVCPDGSKCPSGSTCCQIASGGYGCCPLPDAVCCSDKVHCCPHGYTCDTASGTCQKGMKTVPMLVKTAPLEKTAESNVICPDGKSQCPDGTTCCKLSSGEYGCCPLPNAVCCSDGEHCCPEGYTCDTSAGTCERGMKTVPMLVKTAPLEKTAESNVICPDGTSQCPDGTTCCKLSSGEYGCCPLPNAVCCSDGEHCCPEGYTCDTSAGTCNRGMKTAPMLVKIPALKKTVKVKMLQNNERRVQSFIGAAGVSGGVDTNSSGPVICPDKMYQCPDGNTCCKLHSGSYGCCPIEKAICCNDDKHCCPQGYKCDVKKGKCNKEGEQVSMIDNIPAVLEETDASPSYIECADGSKCLDYETCCEMSDGSYGCCPMPNAFCCEDKEHCCPRGYRCDRRSQSCVSGSKHVPMLTKTKSAHYRKTQEEAVDKKLHFSPGRPKDGKSVQSVDWL